MVKDRNWQKSGESAERRAVLTQSLGFLDSKWTQSLGFLAYVHKNLTKS